MKKITIILQLLLVTLSSCTKENIRVWVASPWEKVMRNTPPGETGTAVLKAASNEFEPFRIIIHNSGSKIISGLDVSVTGLQGKNSLIAAENIKLYRAEYVYIDTSSLRTHSQTGWYPDALIPFKQASELNSVKPLYVASPFAVDTAQNAEIWCDLHVPPATQPGTYTGKVYVRKDGRKIKEIPVSLEVWNFELPEKIAMPSYFGKMGHAARVLGLQSGTAAYTEAEKLYDNELLMNRAVPATPDYVWPDWTEKDGIIDKGEGEKLKELVEKEHFNILDIPFRYKDQPDKCRKYLSATAAWLKRLGYLDISYIYMEDEPNNARQYEIVRKQGALIKSADTGIGRLCTEQTVTQDSSWGNLYGAVNIWCPLWGLWDEKTAVERLAAGEKLWSYTALCQCSKDNPWWQIDTDPVNYRSPMWVSWNYNITGFLYWASVYWGGAKTPADVWKRPVYREKDAKFWGEGTLLYPGEPAGIKGFVPSVRLKLYREAEEDYEYMVLAVQSGKKQETDAIVRGVASSFQKWDHNFKSYLQAREKLAVLILEGKN